MYSGNYCFWINEYLIDPFYHDLSILHIWKSWFFRTEILNFKRQRQWRICHATWEDKSGELHRKPTINEIKIFYNYLLKNQSNNFIHNKNMQNAFKRSVVPFNVYVSIRTNHFNVSFSYSIYEISHLIAAIVHILLKGPGYLRQWHGLSLVQLKHIETEAKWPPFSRRHFQMHFRECKFINFDFAAVCS